MKLVLAVHANGQALDQNGSGISIRYGFSSGKEMRSNPSSADNYPLAFSSSYGVAYLIKVKSKKSYPVVPFLKAEVSFSTRAGQFYNDSFSSPVNFRTNSIDLDVLVPLTGKINDNTFIYFALGPGIAINLFNKAILIRIISCGKPNLLWSPK